MVAHNYPRNHPLILGLDFLDLIAFQSTLYSCISCTIGQQHHLCKLEQLCVYWSFQFNVHCIPCLVGGPYLSIVVCHMKVLHGAKIFMRRSTTSKHRNKVSWNFRGTLGDEINFDDRPRFSFFLTLVPVSFALCVSVLPPLSCHLVSLKGDWVPTNMFLHSSMTSGIPVTIKSTMRFTDNNIIVFRYYWRDHLCLVYVTWYGNNDVAVHMHEIQSGLEW